MDAKDIQLISEMLDQKLEQKLEEKLNQKFDEKFKPTNDHLKRLDQNILELRRELSGNSKELSDLRTIVIDIKRSSKAELTGINAILTHTLAAEEDTIDQIEHLKKRVAKLESRTAT